MSKFFKLTLAASVVLASSVFSIAEGQAAPKAGNKCSVRGQMKTVGKLTYKCVSTSGKLKWTIVKSSTKKEIEATKSEKSSSDVIQIKPNPPILAADYSLVGEMARDSIMQVTGTKSDIFQVSWDPTTTLLKKENIARDIEYMNRLFSPLVPNNNRIRLLVLGANKEWSIRQIEVNSSENPEFGESFASKFFYSSKCLSPNGYVEPDNSWPEDFTTYRGGGGGITPKVGLAFITMSNCDNFIEQDLIFHETFHAVQYLVTYKTFTDLAEQNIGSYGTPRWIIEGQAQYIGLRMASKFSAQNVSHDLDRVVPANIGESWKYNYDHLMQQKVGDEYWVGAIMAEYMIAKFGYLRTMSIFEETVKLGFDGNFEPSAQYLNFDKAFLKIFGQSPVSFYEEVKPYIQWSISDL